MYLSLSVIGDSSLRAMMDDPVLSHNLRMLQALAFVPPAAVHTALAALLETEFFMTNTELLDDFMTYFLRTWIGSVNFRGARSAPLFPIPVWNCREYVLSDLPKTNNFSEGFNRGFSSLLLVQHPSISKLAEALIKKYSLTTLSFEQFNSGNVCSSPASKTIRLKDRLKRVVATYDDVNVIDFLRGVAHCL